MSSEKADDVGASISDTVPFAEGSPAALPLQAKRRALLLIYHRDGVLAVPLSPGSDVVVGREPPSDVIIADTSLSRRHARFTLLEAERASVEDLGSTNGTRVRGRRAPQGVIKPGDEVMLGAVTATIQVVARSDVPSLGLDGHDAFRDAVQSELERARYFGRQLAVITVRPAVRQESHLRHWCHRVRALLRPIDRVAVYSADTLEILLPEVSAEQALGAAHSIASRGEGGPPLVCGVAALSGAALSAETLIEASHGAARRATREQPVQDAGVEKPRTWTPNDAAPCDTDAGSIVAASPLMRAVVETAKRVAQARIGVLLRGETGTGKEVIARLIHEASPRRENPMICINCGSIAATLVEAELFGHERGSFTGAFQQRKGVFEAADGGTVLLDEVGELPLPAQAALLRVLETKKVMRVGSTKEIDVDVRVLAATNRDLEAMVSSGKFRQDLFYRLERIAIEIPALRERREDIAPLASLFLREANREYGRSVRSIEPAALAMLERYSWSGNVRELRSAVDRSVVIADGDVITVDCLPERVRPKGSAPAAVPGPTAEARPQGRPSTPPASGGPPPTIPSTPPAPSDRRLPSGGLKARMDILEAQLILEALREANWSPAKAALILDLPLRTLQYKMREHNIYKRGAGPGAPEPLT